MAVFIELTTDAFQDTFRSNVASKKHTTSRAGRQKVRRPHRGLEIKEDTYATLRVIQSDGTEIPLFDSSSWPSDAESGYSNFILQNVTESRMEKHKIIETFGESYVFFFGEAPRFLDVQAILLNSHDFNWEAEWWANYDTYLRGTKLVEIGARCYMFYDDNIVEGYIMMAQSAKSAQTPLHVSLNFKFFITNYSNISLIGSDKFPTRATVVLPDGLELTQGDAARELLTHLRGDALAAATAADLLTAFSDPETGNTLSNPGQSVSPFGQFKKISDTFRAAARSFAFAPDVFLSVESLPPAQQTEVKNLIERFGIPLRGNIWDNVDEYTGGGFQNFTHPSFQLGQGNRSGTQVPSAAAPTIRKQFEVQNLFREAIEFISCFGGNANSPSVLNDLGLSPSFSASASASAGASFGPKPGGGFGFRSKAQARAESGFGEFDQFQQDPLGAIFGQPGSNRVKDNRFLQGAGDPLYGYPSDFGGVGFGQAGFGDFGGLGFGSGLGASGDPGYKDPSKFTFAGTSNNRDAFDRFLQPAFDPTSFGDGFNATASAGASASAGVGPGGASAQASASAGASFGNNSITSVEGSPSAFALVSVEGTLDATGGARSSAQAISDRQKQQTFGLTVDNPFGVNCPDPEALPGGGGTGFSKNFSFP